MTTRQPRLRLVRRQLPLVALVVLLGLADLLLLVAASGGGGGQQTRAQLEAVLRKVSQNIDQTGAGIREAAFPRTQEVENIGLTMASLAAQNNLQLTSYNATVSPRALAGKEYNVLDSGIEVRGQIADIIPFLREVKASLVSTLQMGGANLRKDEETWVLGLQVLVYYQR